MIEPSLQILVVAVVGIGEPAMSELELGGSNACADEQIGRRDDPSTSRAKLLDGTRLARVRLALPTGLALP